MIHISPRRAFSWSFDIAQSGVPIGSLDFSRFRRSGSFSINEQRFELRPDSLFGPLGLHANGRIIARARRVLAIRPHYRIQANDRELDLRGGLLLRSAILAHGDVVVATLRRPNFFRRALDIDLHQNAPLPLAVFAGAVMILYWRRASRSSN